MRKTRRDDDPRTGAQKKYRRLIPNLHPRARHERNASAQISRLQTLLIVEVRTRRAQLIVKEMNPAKLIDYAYEIAKTYNKFYNDCSILAAETEEEKHFRLLLTEQTGNIIKQSFAIVGIDVPERM